LIDRLPETQLSALVGLLETIVDPVAAALRSAPTDDQSPWPMKNRTSRKRATGSSGAAAGVFRMQRPCGDSAWSERVEWSETALEHMAALDTIRAGFVALSTNLECVPEPESLGSIPIQRGIERFIDDS
jgi:hypothetical protein